MHSFTSKRSGRRTAKTGLPAWGPVNAPGQGLLDAGPRRGKDRPATCRFITPGERCRMKVAVLKETAPGDRRVAVVQAGVPALENAGLTVPLEGTSPLRFGLGFTVGTDAAE